MLQKIALRLATVAFGCLLLTTTAAAQVNTATLLGTVTDSSGGVVPSATVTVTNVGTDVALNTITDSSGAYVFERLPVGNYRLTVTAEGLSASSEPTSISMPLNARRST